MQDSTLPHVFTLGKVWKCHPENVCIKAMTILCFWPESQIRVIVTRIIIKASSTLRASRAVPHPGTDRALRRLTSEFGRDPVHSTRYGRWRENRITILFHKSLQATCLEATEDPCCAYREIRQHRGMCLPCVGARKPRKN